MEATARINRDMSHIVNIIVLLTVSNEAPGVHIDWFGDTLTGQGDKCER